MGSRANYVLVRDGIVRVGDDKWGAQRVDSDVYGGPAATIARVEEVIATTDQDNLLWYDEDCCEGGIFVDVDRRLLVFFGGVDVISEIPLRRAWLEELAERWPGWTVRWASDGIVEIAKLAGVAESVVASTYEPERRHAVVQTSGVGPVIGSVRWEDGEVGVYALAPILKELFTYGESGVLDALRAFDRERGRSRRFEVRNVAQQGPKRVERDDAMKTVFLNGQPWAGLHLDVANRTVFTWSNHPERLDAKWWPEWTVQSLGDRFEAHAELTSGAIVLPHDELRSVALERLAEWREWRLRSATDHP